jgi:hypothetical protein
MGLVRAKVDDVDRVRMLQGASKRRQVGLGWMERFVWSTLSLVLQYKRAALYDASVTRTWSNTLATKKSSSECRTTRTVSSRDGTANERPRTP